MHDSTLYLFCAVLLLVAVLYSSVGQAGASGYIAAMALFGLAPDTVKPTALVLNILVSVVVTVQFYRAGHLSWRLLGPFAVTSVPAAALGGYVTLPPIAFHLLLGALLLVAAMPLMVRADPGPFPVTPPQRPVALLAGAGIGFLSGLTGLGGGVLIAPLLLSCHWATPSAAAALSAVFILVNSIAALSGHLGATQRLPAELPFFALAAVVGGVIGSRLGSLRLSATAIRRILGVTLLVAGTKLLLDAVV